MLIRFSLPSSNPITLLDTIHPLSDTEPKIGKSRKVENPGSSDLHHPSTLSIVELHVEHQKIVEHAPQAKLARIVEQIWRIVEHFRDPTSRIVTLENRRTLSSNFNNRRLSTIFYRNLRDFQSDVNPTQEIYIDFQAPQASFFGNFTTYTRDLH